MSDISYIKQKHAVLNWGLLDKNDLMNQVPLEKRYPVIVTMRDNNMLLGHIVTDNLEAWVASRKDVYRVDVQVGTRYALAGEETDLQ